MSSKAVYVYGAGGHSKVICDMLVHSKECHIVGIIDDDKKQWGRRFCQHQILGDSSVVKKLSSNCNIILGIGDNTVRLEISKRLNEFLIYIFKLFRYHTIGNFI